MDYTLLVIDDELSMHLVLKGRLGDEYNVVTASTAQEGIDKLSEIPVHFILTDIHMPGISGLEFLEALMDDADRKNIPVLIMTSLPSVKKEQKALGVGAADFIDKAMFHTNIEELLNRIRMKLVSNVDIPELPKELELDKKEIVKKILFDVSSGDFVSTTQKLCRILGNKLYTDHLSFWTINGGHVQMLLAIGEHPPRRYGPENLKKEAGFKLITQKKRPYLTNNVYNNDQAVLHDFSRKKGLPAEIGILMFALTEKQLIKNKMKIPPSTPLFGYVILKRKKVFTTKEYKLASLLMMHLGTILWRLYHEL